MLIDGRKIQNEIKQETKNLLLSCDRKPSLGIVLIGDDPASEKFVDLKRKFGESIGVEIWITLLPKTATQEEADLAVKKLDTDGVVVQLPLPAHLDQSAVLEAIPKGKDVDLLTQSSLDDFLNQDLQTVPPVAGAVFEIMDRYRVQYSGEVNILIIGQGSLVGSPVQVMFQHRGVSPDVITLETSSVERASLIREADIIITGAGDPHFLDKTMVKKGVVIIDAGTSEQSGKLKGDVDPNCQEVARLITPVPGGVGPVTIAVLFKNLILLCSR